MNETSLYKCSYEYPKNGKIMSEICFLASHSKEDCIEFIENWFQTILKWYQIEKITVIHGYSSRICQEITLQNYKRQIEVDELSNKLKTSGTFPTPDDVDAYREYREKIRYVYDTREQPVFTDKNTNLKPQSHIKEALPTLKEKYKI